MNSREVSPFTPLDHQDPIRMRLEPPPRIAHEESFGVGDVRGAGQARGLIPGDVAPGPAVGRRTEGLLASVHLPDTVGPIGMTGRSAQDARPEIETLHF